MEDIRRLRAVQCAHTTKILQAISPQDAYRLGFHDLSADKAVTEWAAKHGQGTVHHLEGGLAGKVEGLESVRREKLPSSRMYQLSEYYYKARLHHAVCLCITPTQAAVHAWCTCLVVCKCRCGEHCILQRHKHTI